MSVPADLPAQVMNTKPLFKLMVEKKASDLFFTCNAPVKIKIEGKIFPVNKQILTPETVRQAALGLMTQDQIEHFNEDLEMPEIYKELVMLKRGLILMVGASGAGKSTTLAAMINFRNENSSDHILT